MIKNFTYGDLAAQVARTSAALPDADWNDGSKPKLPLEDPAVAAKFVAAGQPTRQRLPLEDPKIAAAFIAAKQEAPPERRANATWGPTEMTTGAPLVYAPRFKTDHHPWVTDAQRHDHPSAQIRYANYEVEEVQP